MSYLTPMNESERLRALKAYRILDTDVEQVYDDFTFLASTLCETPIALISLVDSERQWFKSHRGLAARETPRDVAFCAHNILDENVMVVEDATHDARFQDNPLVTRDPGIRFYAGAPLITPDGHAIGSLCAIDRKPHHPAESQVQALQALARQVVAQMELQRVSHLLIHALEDINTMKKLIPICVHCKSMRNDEGFWNSVETFISERSPTEFSHAICPDCLEKHYGRDV